MNLSGNIVTNWLSGRRRRMPYRTWWQALHLDIPLLCGLILLSLTGLSVLYVASDQNIQLVTQQAVKMLLAFLVMLVLAQIPPNRYRVWAPWLYSACFVMLVMVLMLGVISKGGQRWLNLGLFRFQPSELMKLALPLVLAWYYQGKPLPPKLIELFVGAVLTLLPVLLVAKQPDLGTALMIAFVGGSVLILAGIAWQWFVAAIALLGASLPFIWHMMHTYQKQRVLTLLNPESDPLGTGYHIIQSKIAIGSGGLLGASWQGLPQLQLSFLPEHTTDFIFAVAAQSFGFLGVLVLASLFLFILWRGMSITLMAQDTFSRLLAGSITLLFFISALVNMAMVSGLLPVVGVPLPLVSYGGTAMVTFIASFGLVMSVHAHKKLIST